jgi:hypothetical protein
VSTNLIKLASKHFLIFLICLDVFRHLVGARGGEKRAKVRLGGSSGSEKNLFRSRFTRNEIKNIFLCFSLGSPSSNSFEFCFLALINGEVYVHNLLKCFLDTFSYFPSYNLGEKTDFL